jgi:hypothetical protein
MPAVFPVGTFWLARHAGVDVTPESPPTNVVGN